MFRAIAIVLLLSAYARAQTCVTSTQYDTSSATITTARNVRPGEISTTVPYRHNRQFVKSDGQTHTICQWNICIGQAGATSGALHLEAYTDTTVGCQNSSAHCPDSKIGGNSNSVAMTIVTAGKTTTGKLCGDAGNASGQIVTFTWSTNLPSTSSDYWLVLAGDDGNDIPTSIIYTMQAADTTYPPGCTTDCGTYTYWQATNQNPPQSALTFNEDLIGTAFDQISNGTTTTVTTSTSTTVTTTTSTTVTTIATATFYLNATTGSDSNDGTARTTGGGHGAWKTLGKMHAAITGNSIVPAGAQILICPGRYYVGGSSEPILNGPGGTAALPINISVDTGCAASGNVEFTAAVPANYAGSTGPWTQAKSCDGTSTAPVGTPCDSDADCGGTANSCDNLSNVYYLKSLGSSSSSIWGLGIAIQPTVTPGGAVCTSDSDCTTEGIHSICDTSNEGTPNGPSWLTVHHCMPTFPEILYAAPSTPTIVPTFTPGKFQVWAYNPLNGACSALHVPNYCCTGSGAGCPNEKRIYVQMNTVTTPDAVTPQVTVPNGSIVEMGSSQANLGPVAYINYTNNNNGRVFFWLWGQASLMFQRNTHHIVMEDFIAEFNSMATATVQNATNRFIDSGAGLRDNGGPQYLFSLFGGHGAVGSTTEFGHHRTFRRGRVAYSAGDEHFHIVYGPLDKAGSDIIQYVEGDHSPWMIANGDTRLYGYAYSWPPTGYSAWSTQHGTHFSPLGGGGGSPGAFIIQAPNETLTDNNFHDVSSNQFENQQAFGEVVMRNKFSCLDDYYGGKGYGTLHPPTPVSACGAGPSVCNGFAGDRCIKFPGLVLRPQDCIDASNPAGCCTGPGTGPTCGQVTTGNIFVDNMVVTRGGSISFACCGESLGVPEVTPVFANNSIRIIGEGLYGSLAGAIGFLSVGPGFGASGSPASRGIVKNNLIQCDAALTSTMVAFDNSDTGNVDVDYNNYAGSSCQSWKWGSAAKRTTFAQWVSDVQATCPGCEGSNSGAPASANFASTTDLHLTAPNSAGFDLSAYFTEDIDTIVWTLWGKGASFFGQAVTTTTVTTSTTSTVTTTSSTSTTSTSTSTSTTSTTIITATTSTSSTVTTTTSTSSTSTTSTSTTSTTAPVFLQGGKL